MIAKQKKAQLTIFIIIGIVLVSSIVLFFVFREKISEEITGKSEENPESFLNFCMEDKIKEAVEIISLHGGYLNNKLNKSFKFEDEEIPTDISYLCYNQNNYLPCINQKPTFMEDLKDEIKNYISEDVENCFNEMTKSFEQKAYEISTTYNGFEVEILPKIITIQTSSESILTKSGETTKQEDFKISIASRLYEISFVAQELVNQEARFCYSENLGIMLIYPEFIIDKFRTGDSTVIYTVENKKSKEKFRFALRGCAIPPGI
tara:strand:+ start:4423 stop:5208 length:786 start_codon:yes stop_codon:yes gene_type:complete